MKLFLVLFFVAFAWENADAQYVSLNDYEVKRLKELIKKQNVITHYYNSLKKLADDALTQSPSPVDTVVSEGHLATDPGKIKTVLSLKDIDKMYALSICYRTENNTTYLKKLTDFLVTWATVNQPQGNPINDTKFEDLFFAYDLVKNKIPSASKKAIDNWLLKMATEEIRTGRDTTRTTSFNNWNSHRLKVVGAIAFILNNQQLKNYINEKLPWQIQKNLYADGQGFDFLERDALHYHVYTLEPLVTLCIILKRAAGKDFYTYTAPSGASISKSVAFFVPFFTGKKTHAEYVNSKVAFDKKRADNKETGFQIGASFKPENGILLMTKAAYFHPAYLQLVKQVSANETQYPNWQAVLNAVER